MAAQLQPIVLAAEVLVIALRIAAAEVAGAEPFAMLRLVDLASIPNSRRKIFPAQTNLANLAGRDFLIVVIEKLDFNSGKRLTDRNGCACNRSIMRYANVGNVWPVRLRQPQAINQNCFRPEVLTEKI